MTAVGEAALLRRLTNFPKALRRNFVDSSAGA